MREQYPRSKVYKGAKTTLVLFYIAPEDVDYFDYEIEINIHTDTGLQYVNVTDYDEIKRTLTFPGCKNMKDLKDLIRLLGGIDNE